MRIGSHAKPMPEGGAVGDEGSAVDPAPGCDADGATEPEAEAHDGEEVEGDGAEGGIGGLVVGGEGDEKVDEAEVRPAVGDEDEGMAEAEGEPGDGEALVKGEEAAAVDDAVEPGGGHEEAAGEGEPEEEVSDEPGGAGGVPGAVALGWGKEVAERSGDERAEEEAERDRCQDHPSKLHVMNLVRRDGAWLAPCREAGWRKGMRERAPRGVRGLRRGQCCGRPEGGR